jgi:hypothetical protein
LVEINTESIPRLHTVWPKTYRIIRSIYPPISLFEDIADPEDWEALASAEAKTNPRLREEIGHLGLVPPARRVSGPGASYVMAPFVHVSPDRPGRFTDGSFGVYSAGDCAETALREVAYHHGRAMAATREEAGWTSQFRMLIGSINAELYDVSGLPSVLSADDYTNSQPLGRKLRAEGASGVVYPSVRHTGGQCIGIFWPDLIPIPVQAEHYDFHWDGTRVDKVRDCTSDKLYGL